MTDQPMRHKFGGGGEGGDGAGGGGGGGRVVRNSVPRAEERGGEGGKGHASRKVRRGDGFEKQDEPRRMSTMQERKRRGAMGILGDDGGGYQLAMRLENAGIWREWLGPLWYSRIVPHLASSASWRDFMTNSLATPLSFQMRVRALLFDKAASCLVCADCDDDAIDVAVSPTSVAPSFLQLNANGVYCNLEQDAEDWSRLRSEGSPKLSSMLAKYDRIAVDSSPGVKQEASEGRAPPVNLAQQRPPPRPVQSLPSLVSPKQEGSRPSLSKVKKVEAWDNVDAKRSIEGVGTISKKLRSPKVSSKQSFQTFQGDPISNLLNRDRNLDKMAMAKSPQSSISTTEESRHSTAGAPRPISVEAAESIGLWYDKCSEKALGDRMRRVAHRSAQQNLPFEAQEAIVRTAEGMAAFIEQSAVRKVKISSAGARTSDSHALEPTLLSPKVSESELQGDASMLHDFKSIANSVPDNPIPARKRRHPSSHPASIGFLGNIDLPSPSALCGADGYRRTLGQRDRNATVNIGDDILTPSRSGGRPSLIPEQTAQVLTQKVVAKLVAGAGFDGLKQSSMDLMCDIIGRQMAKMGSALRLLVENYSRPGSQPDLLQAFIQSTGASLEDLVQQVKSGSDTALQIGTPAAGQTGTTAPPLSSLNVSGQKRRQAPTHQAQQLASRLGMETSVPQQQGHQPVPEKAAKRRQSSNLGRSKRVEKDKPGIEGKSVAQHSDMSRMAGRDLMPMQMSPRLNPQQSSWHPQPPLVQSPLGSVMSYKQQLPSLQLPSVPP